MQQVIITTKDNRVFKGLLIPSDHTVIKLDDGYNVGFSDDEIKTIRKAGVPEAKKHKTIPPSIKHDKKLPTILLVHTGGTIASKVDYSTGGTTNLFKPQEILAMYPELQLIANIKGEFIANMSSDDMRFAHVNKISQVIHNNLKKHSEIKGVVVTTGTDYMHFVACATHYALLGINVPVVFTGSQRSSDRGSSDAPTNLIGAFKYAVQGERGVYIAMHDSGSDDVIAVHHAVNARKMHTSRRDAFKSINRLLAAKVIGDKIIPVQKPTTSKEFKLRLFNEKIRVGMCMLHPNFFAEQLKIYSSFDALILLGSGLGHAPIGAGIDEHKKILSELKALANKIPVVMTSHCINGRVSLQVYSAGRKLQSIGVIGHDLAYTPETAFVKTAFLLSNKIDVKKGLYDDFDDIIDKSEACYDYH